MTAAVGERPAVSVVMPFAGSAAAAAAATAALSRLVLRDGDERILVHNGGARPRHSDPSIQVVPAAGEASPAHARNVGAAHAARGWILFLDADCVPEPDLLDRYFAPPPDQRDGALAGAVLAASAGGSLAGRYAAARSFLDQSAHLAHPYLPRAVAANLLVRREALEAVGGFFEGVRAGEDTDFSWRLQQAGWRLASRPQAQVRHVYRTTVRGLRAQWRGYAAGRAWLSRRYEDFRPEPAVRRAARRLAARGLPARPGGSDLPRGGDPGARGARSARVPGARGARSARGPGAAGSSRDRVMFAGLDALLGLEELVGLCLSNRPGDDAPGPATVVLIAERYPVADDPLIELAGVIEGARVEAAARPEAVVPTAAGAPQVRYREDDGEAARWLALLALLAVHPLRCLRDRVGRIGDRQAPPLRELAPVVARLRGDQGAPVRALGGASAGLARRLTRLSGRRSGGGRRPRVLGPRGG
jgi:GT2 family glycosyltransferase